MLFVILLISIVLCASQRCYYDVDKFKEVSCSDLMSIEKVMLEINDTLNAYGPIEKVIEILKLERCTLLDFAINTLGFLPRLEEIKIINSNVPRFAYEEVSQLLRNTTDFDGRNGM